MIYHTAGYNQQFQFSTIIPIFIARKFTEGFILGVFLPWIWWFLDTWHSLVDE